MSIFINILLFAIALAITLYMFKKGVNIGIVMMVDSVFVAVMTRIPVSDALQFGFTGLVSDKTLKLIMALFLIMILENIMRTSGTIKIMVDNLKELVKSNRLASAILPSVLGLLPSPGGARFSCPMVEEAVKNNADEDNKAFINYWFRHIWMDGFILYPSIILASELIGKPVVIFFFHLLPFMIMNVIIGSLLGLRRVNKEMVPATKPWKESLYNFAKSIMPIILVILLYVVLLDYTGYSLEIACISVIIALFVIKKYDFKHIIETLKQAFPVKLVIIIIGVMIFKEILLGSGAMDGLPGIMNKYRIPVEILFIVLPFVGGFSSGITVSYVSLAFPVLIPLGLADNLWYPALAFTAGSAGSMITPLHLCAVMTADYFKAPIGKMLKKVAVGQAVLVTVATILIVFFLT